MIIRSKSIQIPNKALADNLYFNSVRDWRCKVACYTLSRLRGALRESSILSQFQTKKDMRDNRHDEESYSFNSEECDKNGSKFDELNKMKTRY